MARQTTTALVRPFREVWPKLADSVWLAPNAVVVGDVTIGANSSVWYGTTLRGDVNAIRIGSDTNVQDHCVFHVSANFACTVGNHVTVGHRAVVHGCDVEDGALIGIGAIILDGARVGAEALVGAGAVVSPGTVIPEGMLAVGIPARVSRALTAEERTSQRDTARKYIENARAHAEVDNR